MINLIKASQGDKNAIDEIVSVYNEQIKKIASIYIGNDFEDITQDIWVKIFEKKHLLAAVKNFDNWLFLVVRNACFNYLKVEHKRRKNYGLTLYENIDYIDKQVSCPDILNKIMRDEFADTVRSIINELPEAYSLPIIMSYVKEMPLKEISKTLNLPLSTVKWRIHAAKLQIKNEILKRGLYYE